MQSQVLGGQQRLCRVNKNRNERENMYTNKPKWSHKEMLHIAKIQKKHSRHQHNTDDGGQAMGEEMRHVQMSR